MCKSRPSSQVGSVLSCLLPTAPAWPADTSWRHSSWRHSPPGLGGTGASTPLFTVYKPSQGGGGMFYLSELFLSCLFIFSRTSSYRIIMKDKQSIQNGMKTVIVRSSSRYRPNPEQAFKNRKRELAGRELIMPILWVHTPLKILLHMEFLPCQSVFVCVDAYSSAQVLARFQDHHPLRILQDGNLAAFNWRVLFSEHSMLMTNSRSGQ